MENALAPTVLEMILAIAFGVLAIAGALGVIIARNVVYSALSMLANFCALGALYILLNAEFLGIVQFIIYGGAIVVLFLFALMLVGGKRTLDERLFKPYTNIAAALLALILLGEMAYLVLSTGIAGRLGAFTPAAIAAAGNVQTLGMALLTEYVLPFELVSILLLVGIVGSVALAKKR